MGCNLITNPAFGYYSDFDDNHDYGSPSFGVAFSKKQGDGKWCPVCRKNNFYSWLEYKLFNERKLKYGYDKCDKCGFLMNNKTE